MEQQPGAVNWAPNNAAPTPGMLRVWALEAVAHGAELVSFFRWRQLPVAQEQCHAALTLPDGSAAPARAEVAGLRADLNRLGELPPATARLALVFDYASVWVAQTQPPCDGFALPAHAFGYYRAARRLGLDVDIVPPGGDLEGYDVVLVPAATIADAALVDAAEASTAQWLIGPRSGSRTPEFAIPEPLPPGPWQRLLPLKVIATDALRPGATRTVEANGKRFTISALLEQLQTDMAPVCTTDTGEPVWLRQGRIHYLAAVADDDLLQHIVAGLCTTAGLPIPTPAGDVRLRRRGPYTFVINYGPDAARWRLAIRPPRRAAAVLRR
ncbi:MAG: beta-galactosidase trimerization domain-containing protein [Pseudomonadota bacterium]